MVLVLVSQCTSDWITMWHSQLIAWHDQYMYVLETKQVYNCISVPFNCKVETILCVITMDCYEKMF